MTENRRYTITAVFILHYNVKASEKPQQTSLKTLLKAC